MYELKMNPGEFEAMLTVQRVSLDRSEVNDVLTEAPTLTKAELAELLFEHTGLHKREAKDIVEAFFESIRDALGSGDGVKLSGFGNFQLRDKPQRPGRNPKTGEDIPIAARRVVTFHASQKLKSMVDSGRMCCAIGSNSSRNCVQSSDAVTDSANPPGAAR